VAAIGRLLREDGVGADQYPTHGRIRSFLTDEEHVHDPQDEPDLIDWCVSVGASTLLGDCLSQWHRSSVCLQNTDAAQVLAVGVQAALDAGARHITVVRCGLGSQANGADHQDLVLALVRAASACDSLTLEDFHLLTRDELCRFLDFAVGHCSLMQLSMCRVSGMGIDAMERLVPLVMQSCVLSLHLGEVDADVLTSFLEALNQWPLSEPMSLACLDLSYVITGETSGRLAAQAIDNILVLSTSLESRCHPNLTINCKRSPHERRDNPRGYGSDGPPKSSVNVTTALILPPSPPSSLSADNPGTPVENMVVLEAIETDDALRTDELPREVPVMRPRFQLDSRVVRHPAFLADIVKRMVGFWHAEESITPSALRNRLHALETASSGIAFALTNGELTRLRWIRQVNREHLDLWNIIYQKHLGAPDLEDRQAIREMEALLKEGKTFELIGHVQHLRAHDQLPAPEQITALLKRHDDNPVLRTVGLWAFRPIQAIGELVDEGKLTQLQMWANTLRRVDALPSSQALKPLFDRYVDRSDVTEALFCFLA